MRYESDKCPNFFFFILLARIYIPVIIITINIIEPTIERLIVSINELFLLSEMNYYILKMLLILFFQYFR